MIIMGIRFTPASELAMTHLFTSITYNNVLGTRTVSCSCGWEKEYVPEPGLTGYDMWDVHQKNPSGIIDDEDVEVIKIKNNNKFDHVMLETIQNEVDNGKPYTVRCSCGWDKNIRRATHDIDSWNGHYGNYAKKRSSHYNPHTTTTTTGYDDMKWNLKKSKTNLLDRYRSAYTWKIYPDEVFKIADEIFGGAYYCCGMESGEQHREITAQPTKQTNT